MSQQKIEIEKSKEIEQPTTWKNILLYQHQQQGLHNNQIISVHIMLWLNLLLMLLVNLRNENSRFFDPRQGTRHDGAACVLDL